MMFSNIKTLSFVFIFGLFLCQSGVCMQLNDFTDSEYHSITQCHDSMHGMDHEKKEENNRSTTLSSYDNNSNCCYVSSVNASNFNLKIFSSFELKCDFTFKLIDSSDLKSSRALNKGHPPPDLYNLYSLYLI